MTSHSIFESGMKFGPYPVDHYFHIEKSATYQNIQSHVKMAELLVLHPSDTSKVDIIEAKSSSPRPETQPNFQEFIIEIRDKLTNALNLYMATYLKRHPTSSELPIPFQKLKLDNTQFRLIVIINGHREEWISPLQDALRKFLKPTVKTWSLSPNNVLVLNDSLAKKYGLIS
ncbi:hypothetical protein PN462_19915 [Spirulina sp. CS-785/01]|uniref:hypothetical protein n=1 Tax=Spirulina sp. CS-785/01 TaxID=3021716 RepID=UPI00232A7E74|nr:hypothetical protein [Spirulina sp. CS-785/01]MDB9315392.1 hypothetical protein [Spirulina sp. CS-785/01]